MSRPTKPKTPPRDPWADPPPVKSWLPLDPEDPLAFWEAWCHRLHCTAYHRPDTPGNPRGEGKVFWGRAQSCAPLLDLRKRYTKDKAKRPSLHEILYLLWAIHDVHVLDPPPPRGKRRRRGREEVSAHRRVQRIRKQLALVPEWKLPDAERAVVDSFLSEAERREEAERIQGPEAVTLVMKFPDGEKEIRIEVRPPKPGRPTDHQHRLSRDITLLSECVRAVVGAERYWPVVAELLHHFCPGSFEPSLSSLEDQLRARVKAFKTWCKKRDEGLLDHHRKQLRLFLAYHMKHPTGSPTA